MKKSTVIKLIVALIIVMIVFWGILNYLKNRNSEIEQSLKYNYFVLFQNEKMGVIDRDANIIIEPKYDNIIIPNPDKDIFLCSNNEEEAIFLNKNEEKQFSEFEEVTVIDVIGIITDVPYEKDVLRIKKQDKYGLINYSGNVLVDPIYEEISSLSYKQGEIKVKTDNKYGVITTSGEEIIKPEYDYIEGDKYYSEENKTSGYIVGKRSEDGYKYGYIDYNRKETLDVS